VDAYGVGTSVVTGSGAPTAEFVYKLVARATDTTADAPLQPVAKTSTGKPTHKGRKWAVRRFDRSGVATAELVSLRPPLGQDSRALLVPLVRGGAVVGREPLDAARLRHVQSRQELPASALQLSRGEPAIPTLHPDAP
jgi:nicotinate phosphoribosyltransferase